MNKYSCFIMGLPEAGKTTFLASLWYCINNSKTNKLKYYSSTKNLNYLSDICETWAQLKTIPRTKQGFQNLDITLVLENEEGRKIEITFPDLSGETFQSHYDKREMSFELVEYIKDTTSIILFINPMNIKEPGWIAEIPKSFRVDKKNDNLSEAEVNKEVPSQVQLVELLQFVEYIRKEKSVRLQIIVSAWDILENEVMYSNLTPEKYIEEHLPLLWQYVITNNEYYNTLFWGISAQGGKINSDDNLSEVESDDRLKLLDIEDPCERVFIIDNDGNRSCDITLPLFKIVGETNE